jgi:hypothetical protein
MRSYYHYCRRTWTHFDFDFTTFVDRVLRGAFFPSSWDEHVSSWLGAEIPHFFLIKYEELKADPSCTIGRLAPFLGIAATPDKIEDCIRRSDLASMKDLDSRKPLVPQNPNFIGGQTEDRAAGVEFSEELRWKVSTYSSRAMKLTGYS